RLNSKGELQPTGDPAIGVVFLSPNKVLANLSYDALKRADAGPAFISKPLNASGAWPGEGAFFYVFDRIPTANYITGTSFIVNWGVDTSNKIDYNRMHRLMISFTQMAIDMSHVSEQKLRMKSSKIVATGRGGS